MWRASVLGGINGLAVGGVACAWFRIYTEYRNRLLLVESFARPELNTAHLVRTEPATAYLTLVLYFVILFVLSSLVAHRLLSPRLKSIVMMWQGVAFVAAVGVLLTSAGLYILGQAPSVDQKYLSPDFALFCAAFLLCLAVINLIYGGVIHLSLAQYSRLRGGNGME